MHKKCKSECNKPALKKSDICKPKTPPSKPLGYSEPIIDLPHFIRILGPKHFSIFRNFIPSLIVYTVTLAITTIYITEFKAVLQYLPYYNGRYEEPEDKKKKVVVPEEESQSAE